TVPQADPARARARSSEPHGILYCDGAWRGFLPVSRLSAKRRNTEESMPCTTSTKIKPDSRGLVPVIHVFVRSPAKTWMPATSAGMTSHLDLLVRHDTRGGGALKQTVLVRGVVLQLTHRQFAAHAPGVEDEAVRVE